MKLQGVHTALVTPFSGRDGSVDLDAYVKLAQRQLDAGIHGLVACGTTGETPTLTQEEWAEVVEATVHIAAGKVPVTAGVGTNATRSTIRNIEQAAKLGADIGLLVLPYYNKPNPSGLTEHIRLCAAIGLPLMLYHVPGRTGQRVSAKLLAELASLPGIVGVKEATGDLRYATDLITLTDTPVLSGDDFTFLGLLAQGGRGVVSVVSNVAPAQTVAIYDHHIAGRVADAAAAAKQLWPLIGYLFEDTNPVPCKEALAELGLCEASTRLPLGPTDLSSPHALLASLELL